MIAKRRRHAAYAALSVTLILSACASTPTGPTVAVMPPRDKPFAMFQDDDIVCKHFASAQVDGEAVHENWIQVAIAGGGTLLGAGLGAAIGGGHGAAIGAGAGAMGGTAIGAVPYAKTQTTIQGKYDIAYGQCMSSRGNDVPSFQQAGARR